MTLSQKPLRILIADDDALVRAGIVGILTTAPDIAVVAEAADGQEAIGLVEIHRPSAVLLDIQMPRVDGIRALDEIVRRHSELPVAMLTTFSDEEFIAAAIRAGARGFLLKSDEPHSLIASVRALAAGGGAFSPKVARWLADRERTGHPQLPDRALLSTLSRRQLDLLTQVGEGKSNAQIARVLHLSEGTVKQYLSALFVELGIDNRVHAAVIAYRAGLLS